GGAEPLLVAEKRGGGRQSSPTARPQGREAAADGLDGRPESALPARPRPPVDKPRYRKYFPSRKYMRLGGHTMDEAQAHAALAEVQRQRSRQADRVRVPRWFAVAYGAALVALFAAPAIIVGAAGERKSPLIITVIALGAAVLSTVNVFVDREA